LRSRLTPAGLALAALLLGGCRQDMHDQPKYEPLEASELFADGAASRTPVEGTVARGMLRQDTRLYRGMAADGSLVAEIPLPVTAELVARGRQRFDIFCSPCHGRTGDGRGMIVQRGFKNPQSFHIERLHQVQDGYFYDVITNGFGQMSSYAPQVKPADRWAIVSYVRALQLSRRAPAAALTAAERQRLAAAAAPATEPYATEPPAAEPEEAHQ
jgi:mono/diheme cytochrome c family protein